jgi:hypothetical protein
VAFLVTGGTGTGKTTLLAALLSLVDRDDRVLLVEDAGELSPEHPHVVRLEARAPNVEGAGAVTLRDLVRQALRMRPDRLVVGEVRGAEVVDLLAALNTGHEGGCGTLHANSAVDVPARLEALAASAAWNVLPCTASWPPACASPSTSPGAQWRRPAGGTGLRAGARCRRPRARRAGLGVGRPGDGGTAGPRRPRRSRPCWARERCAGAPRGPGGRRLAGAAACRVRAGRRRDPALRTVATLRACSAARTRPWTGRSARAARARAGARRRGVRCPERRAPGGPSAAAALEVAADVCVGPTRDALRAGAAAAALGGDVAAALEGATDSAVPGMLRGLAACWTVCASTGSGLAAAVERLGEAERAAADQRRAVEVELAGPRATARMLALLPAVGLLMAGGLGAQPLAFLLGSPVGRVCLLLGVGLEVLGLRWTARLAAAAARST